MTKRKRCKTRINAKVRQFLSHLVFDGWSVAKSAQSCGWTKDWGYRLLRREDCLALRRELMEVLRTSESARTIARVANLADNAASEHVKMAANEWLAGIDGLSVVAKGEVEHRNTGNILPGLSIVFNKWEPQDVSAYSDTSVIDTPVRPRVNMIGLPAPHPDGHRPRLMGNGQPLPVPVPHPSMRKTDE